MLWAHAAGCPCSSELHHIGARLVHKMSSCSSDVDSDVDSDVSSDVATDSRWNAVLFRLFFTDDVAFRRKVALGLVVAVAVAIMMCDHKNDHIAAWLVVALAYARVQQSTSYEKAVYAAKASIAQQRSARALTAM
eukprot:5965-Heterococcus_DN1.PRE.1